jgi:predicted ABC-type ATPase
VPTIYIIAGCNGAGKSTAANVMLPQYLDCREFVNADSIAAGLSPFQPETVSFHAGRIMLNRIKELIKEKETFAFETTLTTRSYINLLNEAKKHKYKIVLFYYWLNSVELALARIADRVKKGGHNIPKEVVIRRYERSLNNLVNLFMPISDVWYILDNSNEFYFEIAKGKLSTTSKIYDSKKWSTIDEYKN